MWTSLATSLDGWLVIKYDGSNSKNESNASDSDNEGCKMDQQSYNCVLEIKTPSSKKLFQNEIRTCINVYGSFLHCEFKSSGFKQLMCKS